MPDPRLPKQDLGDFPFDKPFKPIHVLEREALDRASDMWLDLAQSLKSDDPAYANWFAQGIACGILNCTRPNHVLAVDDEDPELQRIFELVLERLGLDEPDM